MAYRRKHDRHLPRSWLGLFFRLGGWVCLIFGILLVAMTFISATQLYLADRMDRAGRFAQAAVVDRRVAVATEADGATTRRHFVTLRYKTAGGGRETELQVSPEAFRALQTGDDVPIRYLRADPGVVETEIGGYRRLGNLFRWVGLGFGIAGLWSLWFFGGRANRAVRARRDGARRFAEVTGIEETDVTVNDRRQGRLIWREADGRTGRSLMRDIGELSRLYAHGDRIVVFRLGDEAYWEGDVGPPRREIADD